MHIELSSFKIVVFMPLSAHHSRQDACCSMMCEVATDRPDRDLLARSLWELMKTVVPRINICICQGSLCSAKTVES